MQIIINPRYPDNYIPDLKADVIPKRWMIRKWMKKRWELGIGNRRSRIMELLFVSFG